MSVSVTNSVRHPRALVSRLSDAIRKEVARFTLGMERRRIYHETLADLRLMSRRELADIGLSCSDFHAIAVAEAMKLR